MEENRTQPTGHPWRPLRSVPLLMVFLHLAVASLGADTVARSGSALASALLSVAVSMLVVLACDADARRRAAPLPHGMQYVMFLVWPVAVPVYLLQTRRWAGLLWIGVWTTTLFLCAVAGMSVVLALRALRG